MAEPIGAERYYVEQFYIGSFEVMDSENEEPVAVCPYYFDQDGNDKEIEMDARRRANAIAAALNLAQFSWQPPKQFDPFDLS